MFLSLHVTTIIALIFKEYLLKIKDLLSNYNNNLFTFFIHIKRTIGSHWEMTNLNGELMVSELFYVDLHFS